MDDNTSPQPPKDSQDRKSDEDFLNDPLDLPGEPDTDDWTSSLPKRSWRRPLIIVAVVIALIAGGFAAWQLLAGSGDDTAQENQQTTQSTEDANVPAVSDDTSDNETLPESRTDVPAVTDTDSTRTSTPRMEVAYPTSWTLVEGDDDVTLESPAFSFTTADGAQIEDGVFRLYIRQGAREQDSSYIGRGVATQSSEPLTYTAPATGQREETNVSFFGLDNTSHIAYLFVAGNFSLDPGDTLGPDFAQNSDTYIIAGGFSSPTVEDDLQFLKMPPDSFLRSNAYQQALDIIRSLQLL